MPTRIMAGCKAPVAQLDRALPSGGRGQGFESLRARHLPPTPPTPGSDQANPLKNKKIAAILARNFALDAHFLPRKWLPKRETFSDRRSQPARQPPKDIRPLHAHFPAGKGASNAVSGQKYRCISIPINTLPWSDPGGAAPVTVFVCRRFRPRADRGRKHCRDEPNGCNRTVIKTTKQIQDHF